MKTLLDIYKKKTMNNESKLFS